MKSALTIIAICEFIRVVQNMIQITNLLSDKKARESAYSEFVKSLKATDKEFVKRMLEEFEKEDGGYVRLTSKQYHDMVTALEQDAIDTKDGD